MAISALSCLNQENGGAASLRRPALRKSMIGFPMGAPRGIQQFRARKQRSIEPDSRSIAKNSDASRRRVAPNHMGITRPYPLYMTY